MSHTIDARSLFADKAAGKSFRCQNTIARSVAVTGFGFWTGKDVTVQFRPAPQNTGVIFVRNDIAGHPRIPALVENRVEKPRQTSLAFRNASVDMVEHVLAALNGLQIDNCEVWTDQPEMPGFDGSSQMFVAALNDAGRVVQSAKQPIRVITRAFHVGNKNSYMIVTTNRRGICEFRFMLIPEEKYPLGKQTCHFELTADNFCGELARTRTFIAQCEADTLLAQGLCQRVTPQNVLILTQQGPLENSFLVENECARHKTLDMVGDFAMLGCDLVGTFESFRGSHHLNAECVKMLLEKSMLLRAEDIGASCQAKEFFREAA